MDSINMTFPNSANIAEMAEDALVDQDEQVKNINVKSRVSNLSIGIDSTGN